MSTLEFNRRNFFKRLGGLLAAQCDPQTPLSNSTLAFFIEDYLLELEDQNVQLDPNDTNALERHSKTLLKNLQHHQDWLPILTLEVRYQQRVVGLLSDYQPAHPLEETLAELERTIEGITLHPTLKQLKEDTQRLSEAVQKFLLLKKVLVFNGLVSRNAIEARADLCLKTFESAFPGEDLPKFAHLDPIAKHHHLQALHFIHLGISVFKNELESRPGSRVRPPTDSSNTQKYLEPLPLIDSFGETAFASSLTDLLAVIEDIESRDCNEMDFSDQIQLKLTWQKFIQIKSLLDAEFAGLLSLRNKGNAEVERLVEAAKRPNQTLKNVIFPIFEELGLTYTKMLASRLKINRLLGFVDESRKTLTDQLQTLPILSSASKADSLKDLEALKAHPRFLWVPYDSPDIAEVRLAFNGMCLVSLVCDGTLLYGNPMDAILYDTTRNLHLTFFSVEKALEFLKDPDLVYDHVRQALTDYKMLMFLMDYDALQRYQYFIKTVSDEIRTESLKCYNVGIQTPTHFQESCIDHSYFWNEWDLRRLAIKMANIRNKKTIGSQTGNSYFKVNNETQIWPLKEKSTMTEVEKGTNPIWPRNYIVGLRSVDSK
jgi:hypothetical protein